MMGGQRIGAAPLIMTAIVGFGAGLLFQQWRSSAGFAPFAPPVSLPASLLILSLVLIFLANRLKVQVAGKRKGQVNPFSAVRLLAAARAAQITGALFTGFGLGLIILLFERPVGVQPGVWAPMALTLVGGALLLGAGFYAEKACRVPPGDADEAVDEQEINGTDLPADPSTARQADLGS